LIVLAVAGCNQILGVQPTNLLDADVRTDLDNDGIADVEDPCVASLHRFGRSRNRDRSTIATPRRRFRSRRRG